MQLIKKTKKGFTLVELIVVIAIVAILAAVSVVSYLAFINSANESADLQLVKQINLCMEASEALHGKNGNMHDALDTAFENGFVLENLTPRSNKDIVWNSNTDRFELLDKAPASNPEIMFKIYNSVAEMVDGIKNEGYSPYLNSKEDFHAALKAKTNSEEFEISTGFDAGENQTVQEITYKNTGAKQTVIFRTNSGDLIVDGAQDTVKHYGVGRYLTIDAVGPTDCYHEYGVFGEAEIHEGKLVIQNSGFLGSVSSDGTNETVVIENKGTIMDATGASQIDIKGSGNLQSKVIEVTTFDQFQGLAYACNQGTTFEGYTIKLMTDIDMTNKIWVPFGIYGERKTEAGNKSWIPYLKICKFFMGTIDGNNHKIINLSNRGYESSYSHTSVSGKEGACYGLIALATGNVTIKDLDVIFDIANVGAERALNGVGIIGQYYGMERNPISLHYEDSDHEWKTRDNEHFNRLANTYQMQSTNVTFDNVNVFGKVEATGSAAAYIGLTYTTNQYFVFDDNAIFEYSNAKNKLSGKLGNITYSKAELNETQMREIAIDGYYYENFMVNNDDGANHAIVMMLGEEHVTMDTTDNYAATFAPLHVNYSFNNCTNECSVYAGDRAAVYFSKLSHSLAYNNLYNISFSGVTNTNLGNVYSEVDRAGIITGYFSGVPVVNANYASGLVNNGLATINYKNELTKKSGAWLTNKDID